RPQRVRSRGRSRAGRRNAIPHAEAVRDPAAARTRFLPDRGHRAILPRGPARFRLRGDAPLSMREFASPASRAGALPRPVKVLYTAFCAFTVAGLLSCIGLYGGVVRFGARATPAELYEHLVTYYRPEAAAPAATAEASPSPISTRRLLEITHFHLFSMPLYLLVVGHLFLLTGAGARAKKGWISASVAGTAAHLLA